MVLASPCIEWSGATNGNGYGVVRTIGGKQYVHRLAYEAMVGPIPEGLTIDHLCRNRACWNPWHLEAVSMRTNLLRGEGFSAENARKTECPRGHPYDEENTYRWGSMRYCRECNRQRRRARRNKAR